MAKAGVLGDLSAMLECSICVEDYKQPKLLHCGHTFCLSCIERQIKTSGQNTHVSCAICRKVTPVPDGKTCNLQTDFRIAQLQEVVSKAPPVETNNNTEENTVASQLEECPLHAEKYTHFCTECKRIICPVLRRTSCDGHNLQPLQDTLPKVKSSILDGLNIRYKEVEDALNECIAKRTQTAALFQTAADDLNKHTVNLLKNIRDEYVRLQLYLDGEMEMIASQLDKSQNDLEGAIEKIHEARKNLADLEGPALLTEYVTRQNGGHLDKPTCDNPESQVAFLPKQNACRLGDWRISYGERVKVVTGDMGDVVKEEEGVVRSLTDMDTEDLRPLSINSNVQLQIHYFLQMLNIHRYALGKSEDPWCPHCHGVAETRRHYFLECPKYRDNRKDLISALTDRLEPMFVARLDELALVSLLVSGHKELSKEDNEKTSEDVITYISGSGRFTDIQEPVDCLNETIKHMEETKAMME